jgi:hypothetical protein
MKTKGSKVEYIKKIIDLQPEHPGSISSQEHKTKAGKVKTYHLWQTSVNGEKVSVRLSKPGDISEIEDIINKHKNKEKIHSRKVLKMVDTFKDAISGLGAGKRGNIENLKGSK